MNPKIDALQMTENDMLQSVVHDLRTPMTVIKGYLQLLISGGMGEMPSEQRAVLQRSVAPLEDLILLTENLLQSMSLQKDQVELQELPVDLDGLLAETVEFYQHPFQQRNMRIFREGNTLGEKILVDAFWFKRLFHNLVWNAFKFTPDGGQVTFHVAHRHGGLEIGIQDNGRGIPADRLEKLFHKFEQAMPQKDRRIGSGLGLWICRRVMELHNGEITVQSIEGRGTCFTLWIPPSRLL